MFSSQDYNRKKSSVLKWPNLKAVNALAARGKSPFSPHSTTFSQIVSCPFTKSKTRISRKGQFTFTAVYGERFLFMLKHGKIFK